MSRKRRFLKVPEKMKPASYWERKFMVRGLFASASVLTLAAIVWLAVSFPTQAACVFVVLVLLAVVAAYILIISRDIDFSGDLKE